MRNSTIALIILGLALFPWAGLLALMNREPPDVANQLIFLSLWWAAVSATITPLSYAVNARFARTWGRTGDLGRAVRQGFLVGVLATILMALRFLRMASLFTGVILTMLVVSVEAIIILRNR